MIELPTSKKGPKPNYDLVWLRRYANMSQQEVADAIHATRVTYARWELDGSNKSSRAAVGILANHLGINIEIIPKDLDKHAIEEENAIGFKNSVTQAMATPNDYRMEVLAMSAGLEDSLPSLPPIAIPAHLFTPQAMKKFNVPEERWIVYTQEKAGESVATLKKAGYSWDQALVWVDDESKVQAYALLTMWGRARDEHYRARAIRARKEKIAMPPLVYKEIVALFDGMLDEAGWGLV